MQKERAGSFVKQPAGYYSFVPQKLPPHPALVIDDEMFALLSSADRKLGRLDGITRILPEPDMFLAMYVSKEALLSSQIEGTQASLIDVLDIEQDPKQNRPVDEVINYIAAMNYGLSRLEELPLSLRLIREIHEKLLAHNARGAARNPGHFRASQNWLGTAGSTLANASFIPPAVPDMKQALADLEEYFYDSAHMPSLIKIGLIHAQFESIHPFLDGNGRVGRLLITFWLCREEILSQPLLYLSYYFKQNRQEYYDRLTDIRKKGDWENWIKFFLRGVAEVSDEAVDSAQQILALKEVCTQKLRSQRPGQGNQLRLLELLFKKPLVTRNFIKDTLDVSHPTAGSLIEDFCALQILKDVTPRRERDKKYQFMEYVRILQKGIE